MKRDLLKQMRHEWRDNIWLVIELLIIGIVICMFTTITASFMKDTFTERGFDVEDVYTLSVSQISEASPEYVAPDSTLGMMAVRAESYRNLLAELRKSPYVEAAALSMNALPYNYNYNGQSLDIEPFGGDKKYRGNSRYGSADIVRVIRPRSLDGKTIEEMEQTLRRGEILISPNPNTDSILNTSTLVGKRSMTEENAPIKKIGGRIHSIRRNDYEPLIGTILIPINEQDDEIVGSCWEIAVRIKPGMDQKFIDEFQTNEKMQRSGNIILQDLQAMKDLRQMNQSSMDKNVRLIEAGVTFFLIIVFLGLIGSFWFRVQQRRGEIAIRKTCGATNRDIACRILSEGYMLVLTAAIPSGLIIAYFVWLFIKESEMLFDTQAETYLFVGLAWLATQIFLLIAVSLGVLGPMIKALKIEPAIVLKEE